MNKILVAFSIAVLAISCGKTPQNKVESSEAQTAATGTGITLTIDSTASSVHWKGSKVGGEHHGTLAVKSGSITLNGEEVTAGSFVVDMNKMVNHDLTDAKMNEMLIGHLKSEDFFDVAKYPESSFTITQVVADTVASDSITHLISGNLKLKDVEKNITFGAKVTKEGDVYKAVTAPFTIDRTQWNVKFGSKTLFPDLKDKIVDDNIELKITVSAKAN